MRLEVDVGDLVGLVAGMVFGSVAAIATVRADRGGHVLAGLLADATGRPTEDADPEVAPHALEPGTKRSAPSSMSRGPKPASQRFNHRGQARRHARGRDVPGMRRSWRRGQLSSAPQVIRPPVAAPAPLGIRRRGHERPPAVLVVVTVTRSQVPL